MSKKNNSIDIEELKECRWCNEMISAHENVCEKCAKIDGGWATKYCRFCDYIIYAHQDICKFCKKDTRYLVPENLTHLSLIEVEKSINDAFFRLESFMFGTLKTYQYFGFQDFFTKLFFEVRKYENFTSGNCDLINEYYSLLGARRYDYNTGDFLINHEEYNTDLEKDLIEISDLVWDRMHEFHEFASSDQEAPEPRISITDIQRKRTIAPPLAPVSQSANVGWKDFINPLVLDSFLDVEKKATAGTSKFDSAIRCAAFCEMIFYGPKLKGKPFMIRTKTPVKTMTDFALSRYHQNIKNSLNGGEKKANRIEHQTRNKNGLPPLKNSF